MQLVDIRHKHVGIYGIVDNKAGAASLCGNPYAYKATTIAVRWFIDCLTAGDTITARHPDDFDLVYYGELTDDGRLAPDYQLILTGADWAKSQTAQPGTQHTAAAPFNR